MTKVLLDCRMAYWSGVGRYSRGLVRGLANQGDLSLCLVTAVGDAPILDGPERATIREAAAHPFSARGMLELGTIARQESPDVLHCLHFPTPIGSRVPLVVTLHDLTPLIVPGTMPSRVARAVYRSLNKRAVRLADQIVTPSQATANDIARLLGASADATTVIPEAADDFLAGGVSAPPALLPAGARFVLSMGNTKPHKDIPCLLASFVAVTEARPDVWLLLVGEDQPGYLDAHVKGEARKRVRFTGRVDDRQLRGLYAAATAFAFPSRYEGFGLPPLEAMSFGTPVVVANAASLPEVVGDAALLVAPGDADALAAQLARVLDDATLRSELSDKGRARAAEFTWAKAGERTAAVYEKALSTARR